MSDPLRGRSPSDVQSRRLTATEARRIAERAAALLTADVRVQLVYFFGSGADPGSVGARDVDLGVLTHPPLTLDDLLGLRADLVEKLHAPIDLVSLNDAPIVLAHEVVEAGVCLHASSEDVETEFVTRTRARYWDFKPYRNLQWRLAGERLEARGGRSA